MHHSRYREEEAARTYRRGAGEIPDSGTLVEQDKTTNILAWPPLAVDLGGNGRRCARLDPGLSARYGSINTSTT